VDSSGDGGTEDFRGKKQFKMLRRIGDKTDGQGLVNHELFGWGTSLADVALREALARRMTGGMVVIDAWAIQCERGDKRHDQKRFPKVTKQAHVMPRFEDDIIFNFFQHTG